MNIIRGIFLGGPATFEHGNFKIHFTESEDETKVRTAWNIATLAYLHAYVHTIGYELKTSLSRSKEPITVEICGDTPKICFRSFLLPTENAICALSGIAFHLLFCYSKTLLVKKLFGFQPLGIILHVGTLWEVTKDINRLRRGFQDYKGPVATLLNNSPVHAYGAISLIALETLYLTYQIVKK